MFSGGLFPLLVSGIFSNGSLSHSDHLFAEDVSTIVIDVGTNTTKAGYAGEDHPRFVIPSVRL
jgi:hypothetical protein